MYLITLVLVRSWVPANTAYMRFLALRHFENSKWFPDLWFVAGTATETENTLRHFWVTSLVVSSVSDIRKLNHINCKKEIPKLKLLSSLQWSLYALLSRGCWASHIYWHDRRKFEGGGGHQVRGSLNFVVEIAAWDMWYMWTPFLFNSSLSQTMTPWLQLIQATFCNLGPKVTGTSTRFYNQ